MITPRQLQESGGNRRRNWEIHSAEAGRRLDCPGSTDTPVLLRNDKRVSNGGITEPNCMKWFPRQGTPVSSQSAPTKCKDRWCKQSSLWTDQLQWQQFTLISHELKLPDEDGFSSGKLRYLCDMCASVCACSRCMYTCVKSSGSVLRRSCDYLGPNRDMSSISFASLHFLIELLLWLFLIIRKWICWCFWLLVRQNRTFEDGTLDSGSLGLTILTVFWCFRLTDSPINRQRIW